MTTPVGNAMASARNAVAVGLGADTTGVLYQALWVGTAGNVVVDMVDSGTNITFVNVPAGTMLPIAVKTVYSTAHGTTAANILGLNW